MPKHCKETNQKTDPLYKFKAKDISRGVVNYFKQLCKKEKIKKLYFTNRPNQALQATWQGGGEN